MGADLRAVAPPDQAEAIVEVARTELDQLRRAASDEIATIERQIAACRQKALNLQLERAQLIGRVELLTTLLEPPE